MCGQSGVAGTINHQERKAAELLMMMNINRGIHSTGIAVVKRPKVNKSLPVNDKVRILKELGTPFGDGFGSPGLFGLKNYDKVLNTDAQVIMTHNRSATAGDVSRENAHPFWFPKLVGTHNGTLNISYKRKLSRPEVFETDSECLFNTINNRGVQATIKDTEGSYAIVYVDLEKYTLNFLRNSERPLHYVLSKDRTALFWSSDVFPLLYALEQARVSLEDQKVRVLSPDTLLTWKIPMERQAFIDPLREKLEGYKFTNDYNKNWTSQRNQRMFGRNPNSAGHEEASADWQYENEFGYSNGGLKEVPEDKEIVVETEETDGSGHIDYSTYSYKKPEEKNKVPGGEVVPFVPNVPVVRKPQDNIPGLDGNRLADPLETGADYRVLASKRVTRELNEMAERRFVEMYPEFKGGNCPDGYRVRLDTSHQKVFWDYKKAVFVKFDYATLSNRWTQTSSANPPHTLPFTLINVEAGGSHLFKYRKQRGNRGKKRQVYYKGYRGQELDQSQFLGLMEHGCINCQRSDMEWGNEVRFIDAKAFLCEHCMNSPPIAEWWKNFDTINAKRSTHKESKEVKNEVKNDVEKQVG